MAYGLEARLFVENGPAIHAQRARAARSSAWRSLGSEQRLAIVEQALKPANDEGPDGFPIAL